MSKGKYATTYDAHITFQDGSKKSMPVQTLIYKYKSNHPNGHFFDADTLDFFGERISDMRIYTQTVMVTDWHGNQHECYELRSTQRNAPGGTRYSYHYFDVDTFEEVHPAE